MHWRRKWQPIPVLLPGESLGRGSLVGCRLWGRTESDRLKRLSSSSRRYTDAHTPRLPIVIVPSLWPWWTPEVRPQCSRGLKAFSSVQSFSRVQLCDPTDYSTPGFPVHYQLPELTQTHVHRVSEAIQPSHPLSSPSPPAFSLSQGQGLFK